MRKPPSSSFGKGTVSDARIFGDQPWGPCVARNRMRASADLGREATTRMRCGRIRWRVPRYWCPGWWDGILELEDAGGAKMSVRGSRAVRQLRCPFVCFRIIVDHIPHFQLPTHPLATSLAQQTSPGDLLKNLRLESETSASPPVYTTITSPPWLAASA